ncbi:MAG: hypothetical protein KF799_01160 [Bdellovibrionales bacterium]|nr:hypothetical protein [Bdellovibrionales bacterium]
MAKKTAMSQPRKETENSTGSFNFGRKVAVRPLPSTGGEQIPTALTTEDLRKLVRKKTGG